MDTVVIHFDDSPPRNFPEYPGIRGGFHLENNCITFVRLLDAHVTDRVVLLATQAVLPFFHLAADRPIESSKLLKKQIPGSYPDN